jgi:hypothetical protein
VHLLRVALVLVSEVDAERRLTGLLPLILDVVDEFPNVAMPRPKSFVVPAALFCRRVGLLIIQFAWPLWLGQIGSLGCNSLPQKKDLELMCLVEPGCGWLWVGGNPVCDGHSLEH